MEFRPSALLRVAAPLRSLAQRFMYVGLIVLSFGLMLVGKIDVVLIDHLRAEVTNVAAPVLAALSRPASSISNGLENIRGLMYLREENARLLEENTKLKQWVYVARRLHTENTALQGLLHSVADPKPKFVTARIIAGTMGSISNTFVINAGSEDGVGKGQPVLSDKGFVGRIVAVSKNSARILLATDINSRIPVILESTRTRALMVGGNMERPKLIHLPPGAQITSSERIVTSGHGGVFPPGLPVGLVASVNDVSVEVQLFTDYHLIEFVRIADFGVNGIVDLLSLRNKVGGSASKEK
jgi:rod shape-determining protein MreC